MRPTQDINGTAYDVDAAPGAIEALERARASGARVRLFYGDPKTGKAWPEESDVVGTIGRSMGAGPTPMRVPLLIRSSRSRGGGAISTGSIVAIMTAPGRFAYRHPSFDPGAWSVTGSGKAGYKAAAWRDGELQARFETFEKADRFAAFMRGERMAP